MTPKLFSLAAVVAIAIAAPAASQVHPGFDRSAWKADYERIKTGLAQGYANLDWQVDRRGFNLQRADGQIGAMLDKANSDVEAALILNKLIDAFDDPHLQLQLGPPPEGATRLPLESNVDGPTAPGTACDTGHYSDGKSATRLPYSSAPRWRSLSGGPFLAGMIGDIGVIRIPAFGEDRYLSACRRVAKPGMDARALQLATRAELNRQLAALIGMMRAKGMRRLAIDISGNGGGSEWSSEVAAMMAAEALKRQAPRLAGPSCDRSSVWQGKRPCAVYAKPAETETIQGTGLWTGPLAILVDRKSASASEEFITWLKGNGRAVVAGERTLGAGCGYVDGGYAIPLKAAPLHVMVPNCSRYTAEGINEIEGIAPDVPVDWAMLAAKDVPALLESLFKPS